MNIKLSDENIKLFILLALFPIFIFSMMTVSKIIYTRENFISPNYEENNLKILKIIKPVLPFETVAVFRVEIAGNPKERELGLSGRNSLPKNSGMLFIFSEPDFYNFWMKDMIFGLDFIWINGSEIVEITKNVKQEDYNFASTGIAQGELSATLTPKKKVDKVLEVNAGVADRLGIKVGYKIEF